MNIFWIFLSLISTRTPTLRQWLLIGLVTLYGLRLSSFLFARIISTKSDARFDSFFIHEGEAWFTAPTYYPLKLSFMWIMQIMWVFTVLLPVTIVLWKAPGAANMDLAWHDWIFFLFALTGTSKPRFAFGSPLFYLLSGLELA